eukprot:404272-Alexandrium_andersonii.AAC.1
MDPWGRHSPVLTKLRCLGLGGLRRVVLLDADILPRRPVDALFTFAAPAAKLMPAHLPPTALVQAGEGVPREWLAVDQYGVAGRFNAG